MLASPLGAALMASTVAIGQSVTPKLWRGNESRTDTKVNTPYHPPPQSVLDPLRAMMREVVTDGTGTGAKGAGTVFGKTGTALPDLVRRLPRGSGVRGDGGEPE